MLILLVIYRKKEREFFFKNTERFILQCVVDLVSIIRQRKSKKGVNVITLEEYNVFERFMRRKIEMGSFVQLSSDLIHLQILQIFIMFF